MKFWHAMAYTEIEQLEARLHDYRPTPSTLEYKLSGIEQFADSFF